ncbi:MAG: hypothetical protein Q7U51_13715 [Methanoregula sp.]|nr:hypothetical protein [Methanoregula sp.]
MAFQWADFLIIAKSLHESGRSSALPTDAAFRCAISRAYYGAFCHSRDYAMINMGFIPTQKPKDHELLRNHFAKNGKKTISTTLDRMRQWRNHSDYHNPSPTLSENNTRIAIEDAEKIIQSM